MQTNFDIEQFLDLTNYEKSRDNRRKGFGGTQEYFTPYSIVKRMCDKVSDEDWADPKKTFLEPSCGNFQFILFILYRRIYEYNIDWKQALMTTFGLDLMPDNIEEGKQRVHKMFEQICPDYDKDKANDIMDHNFVCSNFFEWNFEEWRPMTEEEIKKAKKRK